MAQMNWDQFNTATQGQPTGTKLYLAIQLLNDVVTTLERFDNPLESDAREVLTMAKAFRKDYKEQAAARAKAKES